MDQEPSILAQLQAAVAHAKPVRAPSQAFYKYPARFSPVFARTFIEHLTRPGQWVLDPFVGGGTSAVEALCCGRRFVGGDLSSLAHFVSTVKTTPLSESDRAELDRWLHLTASAVGRQRTFKEESHDLANIPPEVRRVSNAGLWYARRLPMPRQRRFARAVLLRFGQWATEREAGPPPSDDLVAHLRSVHIQLHDSLDELVTQARVAGIAKNRITGWRRLAHAKAADLGGMRQLKSLSGKVRLVVTSPPYPGVHVLYHRWQVRGRRETAAPFWIAGVPDGEAESYYTFGGRKQAGFNRYFKALHDSYVGLRPLLHPDAIVAQLVAFSDPGTQRGRFLGTMERAGYQETSVSGLPSGVTRKVPGRRWYAQLREDTPSGCEHLLLHRLRR
ncbi:MAG: DNA methyltransferase [Bacteroidota bacterium]